MRVLWYVPALTFFLLVGGQVLSLPGQAHAWVCCNYCQCNYPKCYCNYHHSSCYMAGPCKSSSGTFRVEPLHDTETLDISGARGPLPLVVTKPEVSERLMDLARGGNCVRGRFTRNMLASAGDSLKFEPARFESNKGQGQDYTLAFQMVVSEEK